MDAPFPEAMMPDIERFFREIHPKLKPGLDVCPEVFATSLFFPLQRPRELAEMMRIARKAGPGCPKCDGTGGGELMCGHCVRQGTTGPLTVMEIGADKGGGLYHWCMCLPTVRNVIACEVRGTPYAVEFERAFPDKTFWWIGLSRYGDQEPNIVDPPAPIDVLFIDGDKLGMLKDFDAYLPLMRRPGGVVFLHDVSDDHPAEAFKALVRRGYKVDTIIDRSEGIDAASRADRGESPRTSHDQWLMHWRGRSCGVGVIYL